MSISCVELVKKLWPEGVLLKALLGIAQQFISFNGQLPLLVHLFFH